MKACPVCGTTLDLDAKFCTACGAPITLSAAQARPAANELQTQQASTFGREVAVRGRDWWGGVAIVTLAILMHALFPRYEWHHPGLGFAGHVASGAFYTDGIKWPGNRWIRIDRWTGRALLIVINPDG